MQEILKTEMTLTRLVAILYGVGDGDDSVSTWGGGNVLSFRKGKTTNYETRSN